MKWQVFFLIFLLTPTSVTGSDVIGGQDRDYSLGVELSQWDIVVFDLNSVADLVDSGVSYDDAMEQSRYTDRITFPNSGQVHMKVYSIDIQHGISIPELDIQVPIDRTDSIDSPKHVSFTIPQTDEIVEVSCLVYCGLGHGDMKFKFVFGEGEKQYGSIVVQIFVFTNLLILAYFIRKIRIDLEALEEISDKS